MAEQGVGECSPAETGRSADARFTWYSLQDQVDWDTALRENNGRVNPLGFATWIAISIRSATHIKN